MLEINKIHQGDCIEGLRKLNEESVDLVITDPPYNSEKKMGKSFRPNSKNQLSQMEWFMYDQMSSRGYLNWLNMVLREIYRVCKQGTHIYLFCNWKSIRNMMDALECSMFTLNNVITWDKGHFGVGFNYRSQTEFIIFASKNKPRKLNNMGTPNIVKCKRVSNKEMNTLVQKPVELIEFLINSCAKKEDLVLDPFMSSGTTAIACKKNNLNFIGFEINKDYIDIANKRLNQEVLSNSIVPPSNFPTELFSAEKSDIICVKEENQK